MSKKATRSVEDLPHPVISSLLQQDVFIRDVTPLPSDLSSPHTPHKFISVDLETSPGCVKEVETLHDYPITSEYVNSFAEAADYRTGACGVTSGVNLGDVREIQKLLTLDSSAARSLYDQLRYAFEASAKASTDACSTSATQSDSNDVNNNGGSSNG